MISKDMYDDELWAIVAKKAGFEPIDTESSARMAFRYCAPIMKSLYEALNDADQHLDFCGYGDSWERECAMYDKLPEKIGKALTEASEIFGEIER